jgi:exodeoxyribonuclease V alpha subunit
MNPAWFELPELDPFARRLGRELLSIGGPSERLAALAAISASHAVTCGHTAALLGECPVEAPPEPWPLPAEWESGLEHSVFVGNHDSEGRPLVRSGGRIYLARFHAYERRVAEGLRQLAARRYRTHPDTPALLAALFPGVAPDDLQQLAAATAATRGLTVLSGGPGTGKTTTILRIAGLLACQPDIDPARILLAAPTGKAAQRLQERLVAEVENLPIPAHLREQLPREARTLQAHLRSKPQSVFFRHDASEPLPADVVIVDEVSMVDLPLLSKLLDALPENCRLVLVGDADQLVSVQAGAVLADILDAVPANHPNTESRALLPAHGAPFPRPAPSSALGGTVVCLRHIHRFGAESAIAAACSALLEGNTDRLLGIVGADGDGTVVLRDAPEPGQLARRLEAHPVCQRIAHLDTQPDAAAALRALSSARLLCALREGPSGSIAVNDWIGAARLRRLGANHRHGAPLLVTSNAPALRLANGHVGVLWNGGDSGLRVHFGEGEGPGTPLTPQRLPPHEPGWAMTVHKSQGSEFDEVLLILGDQPSRLHTRELLYTALSRARRSVEIWGSREVLALCAETRVKRLGGLAWRLSAPA